MTNYTEAQLSSMKLADIVAAYNELAASLEANLVKRFSSKQAAVARLMRLQQQRDEQQRDEQQRDEQQRDEQQRDEQVVEDKKDQKTEEITKDQQVVSIANKPNFRKGSIGEMMFDYITANEGISFQTLIDYMVVNYKKPRADSEVDAAFITSTVRYFVRKGALEIK